MFQNLKAKFSNLMSSPSGASAVEYAILIGLIAIAVIAGAILLGPAITGLFTSVSTQLPK